MAKRCEEKYSATIVEIQHRLSMISKDDSLLPNKSYRSSLEAYGYTFKETIGEGAFAKVKKAYCNKLHRTIAVKIIHKAKLPDDVRTKFLPREIALLQKLGHDSLLVLHEVYESRNSIYLVMEYLPNGDLLEYVNKVGCLGEVDSRRLFHQLLDVVNYLHEQDVYHRDIKLDNILLDDSYNIRLTDFGFARYNPKHLMLSTFCGSYAYAAPEILDGDEYSGAQVDIWSMGVCLYAMLNGKFPFRDADVDILRSSMNEKVKFTRHVSKDCRELIRCILNTNVRERISISAIRKSHWMCKPMPNNDSMSMSSLSVNSVTAGFLPRNLDTNSEHGFTCAQHKLDVKSTKVTDILKSVAVNHTTGTSSINLKEVVPAKVSATAMTTGVLGPVGQRINTQLSRTDLDNRKLPMPTIQESDGGGGGAASAAAAAFGGAKKTTAAAADGGGGLAKFKKASRALTKFQTMVKVVTALHRFKRGPLDTILTIPQEEAMAKMISSRGQDQEKEKKQIHVSSAARVASALGEEQRKEKKEKREAQEAMESEKQMQDEKFRRWGATFAHLIP